jgi:hypothetical protein
MCRSIADATMDAWVVVVKSLRKGNVTAVRPPAKWTEPMVVSGTPEEILERLTTPEPTAQARRSLPLQR